MCKVFSEQGHSGFSASYTLRLFKKLMIDEETLSPLTNNPDEWTDITDMCNKPTYQSKGSFHVSVMMDL